MVMVASRFLRYIPEEPMSGPDVRGVQEQLRALGFYPGVLDGIFGRGTHDAVLAFQARRGLSVDGIVGPATYNALGSPATPSALGDRGSQITIDLEQRRLYFGRMGRVERVYPVAVGAPATPTPVGRWVVVQKAFDPGGPFGTRWIRLNIPWGGYGIHGTNDPPSIGQAVSHGCIRMYNPDVEQLYERVPIGTVVTITGQIFTGRVLIPGQASGSDVRAVQELLAMLGYYQQPPDGVYGPVTAEAVRRFQSDQGLVPDAIVGPNTYDALIRSYAVTRGLTAP